MREEQKQEVLLLLGSTHLLQALFITFNMSVLFAKNSLVLGGHCHRSKTPRRLEKRHRYDASYRIKSSSRPSLLIHNRRSLRQKNRSTPLHIKHTHMTLLSLYSS